MYISFDRPSLFSPRPQKLLHYYFSTAAAVAAVAALQGNYYTAAASIPRLPCLASVPLSTTVPTSSSPSGSSSFLAPQNPQFLMVRKWRRTPLSSLLLSLLTMQQAPSSPAALPLRLADVLLLIKWRWCQNSVAV